MATMICLEENLYLNMDYVLDVRFHDEENRYDEDGNMISEFDEDTQPAYFKSRLVAVVATSVVIDVENLYSSGYHKEVDVKYYRGKPAKVLKMYLDKNAAYANLVLEE